MNKNIAEIIIKTSFVKTFVLNFRNFGLKALFRPKIIVAKHTKIPHLFSKKYNSFKCKGDESSLHIGFATNMQFEGNCQNTLIHCGGIIEFSGHNVISRGCSINVYPGGVFRLNGDVHISQNSTFIVRELCELGNMVTVSWNCQFMDSDSHPIYDFDFKLANPRKPILIADHCWICCGCSIFKGGVLHKNSILSHDSFLSKDIKEENVIVSNNKVLKKVASFDTNKGDQQ